MLGGSHVHDHQRSDVPTRPATFLLRGEPVTALCRHAGGATIAMTTHGRSGLSRTAFGCVMAGVVHRTTGPVLVVGPAFAPSDPAPARRLD